MKNLQLIPQCFHFDEVPCDIEIALFQKQNLILKIRNAEKIALRETVTKLIPNFIGLVHPKDALSNWRFQVTCKPWENHGVTTFPRKEERISGKRRKNRPINELELIFGHEAHLHSASLIAVVQTIQRSRNKNQRRILARMLEVNIGWILSVLHRWW